MSNKMLYIQGSMMVLTLFGYLLRKNDVINDNGIQIIYILVTKFILPMNIFCSCMLSFSPNRAYDIGVMILSGIIVEIILYFVIKIIPFKEMSLDRRNIARYGLLISNGGLIGIPVIESLYGSDGVMLANMFLLTTRVILPSMGVKFFSKDTRKEFSIRQIICDVGVIAVISGVSMSILQLSLPPFIFDACNQISSCLSPVVFLLIGSMLYGNLKSKDKIEMKNIFEICILKQMLFPLSLLAIVCGMPINPECKGISIILLGMPLASASAMYAKEYRGDYMFAAKSVALSTVSSFLSLVLLSKIIEIII